MSGGTTNSNRPSDYSVNLPAAGALLPLLLSVAILGGCASRDGLRDPAGPAAVPVLPPLPPGCEVGPGAGALAEVVPAPRQARIALAWSNAPVAEPCLLVTGLEASTDLVNWSEVARLPYTTEVIVVLTNRPPAEFYRAFNAWATERVERKTNNP